MADARRSTESGDVLDGPPGNPTSGQSSAAGARALERRIARIRAFNRFLTREVGALQEGLLHSPYSLPEARLIFELAHRPAVVAATLSQELGLDPGYLSRLITRLEERGLVDRRRSSEDGRQRLLELTDAGRAAFALLDARARDEIADLLEDVAESDQTRLVAAMDVIERVLGKPFEYSEPFVLRPPEPGDLGWVVQRHGALYAREYGWDASFEALVARIVADFARQHDPPRERCWIAEMHDEPVGSVFLVDAGADVGKLRLLLVEPAARGLGLGTRLVDTCVRFARRVGYGRLTLWTNDVLVEARRIYERAGFELTASEPHHSFGHDLVGQTWDLAL
jgi:DNA-binding MarR family transcriptional regulator/N-acetylglutamate synthase-like GNAT family acetyltransferase